MLSVLELWDWSLETPTPTPPPLMCVDWGLTNYDYIINQQPEHMTALEVKIDNLSRFKLRIVHKMTSYLLAMYTYFLEMSHPKQPAQDCAKKS